ncbi:MAG: RnfABCDGE type electron transport complex subunit D [Clostridiales bacterium]|nr:RnfABCDGE type electron transport complex subunit D [Clostridiales bacterium]
MKLHVSTGPHVLTREVTQTLMLDVLIALAPTTVAGVYLFGLRAAWVICVSVIAAMISEYVWQKLMKQKASIKDLSAIVTGLILGLNLPSGVPLWMAALASAIAIILVKQLFGGIGNNFMNPAMFGRAFLLASWPARMTSFFLPERLLGNSQAAFGVDMISGATPLVPQKLGITLDIPLSDLLLGNIPGSIGEVCKIAILIGLVYMLVVKVISWHIPVFFVGSVALLSWLLGNDPLIAILSGGVLFGAVFMATDYATNPMQKIGHIIFGIGCGTMVVVIRKWGNYPEGVTYAILFMNCLTPLIDRLSSRRVYGMVKNHV